MRKTPQYLKIVAENYLLKLYLKVKTYFAFLLLYIKLLFNLCNIKKGWGQFAWLQIKYIFAIHQRLNVEHPKKIKLIHDHSNFVNRSNLYNNKEGFYQWLVGFTDGDGSFTLYRQVYKNGNSKWNLFFKLSQSSYNLRVLYYIKKELGFGSVQVEYKTTNADFRIRDRKIIKKIFPIFDKYPLLTNKYFDYIKFKRAYEILADNNISYQEKDILLLELKNQKKPQDYISSAWKKINYIIKDTNDAKFVISKYWLIGFTEAEGSFYLVKKSSMRLVHGFEITQKLDIIILQGIAKILGISVITKSKYNIVVTTNSRAIINIIDYFKNTMKGMKALEYKIWAKSFLKFKGNFNELSKVQKGIKNIRLIRLDKNCRIKKK